MIHELDSVALTVDHPERDLEEGDEIRPLERTDTFHVRTADTS